MQEIKNYIMPVCFGLIFVWGIGKVCETIQARQGLRRNTQALLISPEELQQRLKDLGYYGGEVDGIVGPKTLTAWNKAINQQYANPYFEKVKK
jgi:hypothetical protein